jgi:hypothetical protein
MGNIRGSFRRLPVSDNAVFTPGRLGACPRTRFNGRAFDGLAALAHAQVTPGEGTLGAATTEFFGANDEGTTFHQANV